MNLYKVLNAYGLRGFSILPFGNGLINSTWVVENKDHDQQFILQRINQNVFKYPENIAFNIRLISDYLKRMGTLDIIIFPIPSNNGKELVKTEDGYFRLFPFVKDSHTTEVVKNIQQAFEAAKQFGKFTKVLSALDPSGLKITLPDFHNMTLRYKIFEASLINGDKERILKAKDWTEFLISQKHLAEEFEKIKLNKEFKIRVTHNDTKISNVLFDSNDKGICVIDLDTVMPGYFISDVGDMMRTYLSPVSEEEKDFTKINVREDYFDAIVDGYVSQMGNELSSRENKYFFYAGKFMIYMQALRFVTDYLNNDIYYGAKYPDQNFVRACNQIILLQKFLAKAK